MLSEPIISFQLLIIASYYYRAEEKRDLLMFFRSLHFFVEWYEYRRNTFKHFKVKSEDFKFKYMQKMKLVLILLIHSQFAFFFCSFLRQGLILQTIISRVWILWNFMQTRQASNSQTSAWLCFSSAGINSMYYIHALNFKEQRILSLI